MAAPLRVLLFDRTCVGEKRMPGLSAAWRAGSVLYRGVGRIDQAFGVTTWDQAAQVLAKASPDRPLEEVQYWGHGNFGRVLVDRDGLDARSLDAKSPARFCAVLRERLASASASSRSLFWLRTCEAFGARVGQDFAQRLAEFLNVPVAGHTHVIGFWQGGLHGLHPGARPSWSEHEGVERGTSAEPKLGAWSTPFSPNTIHCLQSAVPPNWFDRSQAEISNREVPSANREMRGG